MNKIVDFIKNCFSRFKCFLRANFIRFKEFFSNTCVKTLFLVDLCLLCLFIATCVGVDYYKSFNSSNVDSIELVSIEPPSIGDNEPFYSSITSIGALETFYDNSVVVTSSDLFFNTLGYYYSDTSAELQSFNYIVDYFDLYYYSYDSTNEIFSLSSVRPQLTSSYNNGSFGYTRIYTFNSGFNICFKTPYSYSIAEVVPSNCDSFSFEIYNNLTPYDIVNTTKIERVLFATSNPLYLSNRFRFYNNDTLIATAYFRIENVLYEDLSNINTNTTIYEPIFSFDFVEVIELSNYLGNRQGVSSTTEYYNQFVIPEIKDEEYQKGYDEGFRKGSLTAGSSLNLTTFFENIRLGISNFFDITLFGGFKFGHTIFLMLSVFMIYLFIRQFLT